MTETDSLCCRERNDILDKLLEHIFPFFIITADVVTEMSILILENMSYKAPGR